jgi:hypothetical protein
MLRRVFWLAVGLGAGVTVGLAFTRWARRQADRVAPANVARQAGETVKDVGALLTDAFSEFRKGMAEKEQEVRAGLEA